MTPPLFNPTGDKELWHRAALANKELLDAADAAKMKLIDDYAKLWTKNNYKDATSEIIFGRRADRESSSMETSNFPAGLENCKGGNCPTQNLVDAYEMVDGKPWDQSAFYDPANPCANRDPRLKQMVLNNEFFEGNSAFVGHEVASDDAYVNTYCTTGYQTIKGYDPSTGHSGYMLETADGIAYRYAETLLINAEAKAELGDIDQTDLDNTINVLRDRVGMPHLTLDVGFTDPDWPDYGTDISPLLQEIRRERRIELAGEGFRWNDLCRWKAGELLENPMTYVGKKVTTGTRADEGYAIVYSSYTNSDLSIGANSRQWDDKMYLLPIPTNELQLNPELEQNPGW